MADHDVPLAYLVLLHQDILSPGDSDVNSSTMPPTRTEAHHHYPLVALPCVIGRDPTCAIHVRAYRTDISRQHVVIERDGAMYLLRDQSRHGTYINGQRITGCRLDTGDAIGLASAVEMLRFLDPAQTVVALTEREIEILQALAVGRPQKEIALLLSISLNTVNTHVKNIYRKLDVSNASGAINQARKLGLIA